MATETHCRGWIRGGAVGGAPMKCRHEFYRVNRSGKVGRCVGCRESMPATAWRAFVDRPPIGYRWGLEHDGEPRIVKVPREKKVKPACRYCGVTGRGIGPIEAPKPRRRYACFEERRCATRRLRAILDAEWRKWRDRTEGADGWQDRAGAFRGRQAIEDVMQAMKRRKRT